MDSLDVLRLANEIVKLDEKRDQMWEALLQRAGDSALEILRYVQNSKKIS